MGAPTVNPDGLTSAYWNELTSRISESIRKLTARSGPTVAGRTVPEDEHLVIGEGKHLRAAIMFLDICGFSSWDSGDFAEQANVLTAFNIYFSEMVRVARDYGGEIEKNTGDGLLAYFDLQPNESESNLCKRALACPLAMLPCTGFLINPILRTAGLPEIHFRVGMDFGPVTIAKVGSPRLFNSRVAIGAIANVANKMLQHAKPDQVVIGNEIRSKLPTGWARHASLLTLNSGFVYKLTGSPYPLFLYEGRWRQLS